MKKGYEVNEKDIETVLGILKRSDPNNATPELAIAILEQLKENMHMLAHANPEKLLEMLGKLKSKKKASN